MDNIKITREEKLQWFEDKIKDNPNNGRLWLKYATFLEDEYNTPQKTVHAYERAQELIPTKDLRLRIAESYMKLGEFQKGESLIKESIRDNPRAHAYCILAYTYLITDRHHEAQIACEKSIEIDPEFEEAYYLLGESLKYSAREKAIEHYRKAIKLDNNYQLAWQALGRELIAEKNTINEGVAALEKALQLNPEDSWANIFFANALWKLDKIKEANEQYKKTIEKFPGNSFFKKCYQQFLEQQEMGA